MEEGGGGRRGEEEEKEGGGRRREEEEEEEEEGGSDGERVEGGSDSLADLCEALVVPKSFLMTRNYKQGSILDHLSKGAPQLVREVTKLRKLHKTHFQKGSQFGQNWKEFDVVIAGTRVALNTLCKLLGEEVPDQGSPVANIQALQARALELATAEEDVVSSVKKVQKLGKVHKKELSKRLSNNQGERCPLQISNYNLPWWRALAEVESMFEAKRREVGRNHLNNQNHLVSGFRMDVYKRVSDHFTFLRISQSEYTTLKEVAEALGLPKEMRRRLLEAMTRHLPVSQLSLHGKQVLLDSSRLRDEPEFLIKVCLLEKEKRVLRSAEEVNTRGGPHRVRRKKRTLEQRREAARAKHGVVLEKAKEIVETGVGNHGGVEADLRRRSELGMASITIPELHKKLIASVEPGTKVPGKVVLRRWMVAPSAHRKEGSRYLGLIPARVPHKVNTRAIGGSSHPDSHGAAAMVKMTREWASRHSEYVMVVSADDKAKIPIGAGPFQHRLSRLSIYHEDNAPVYPDHDRRTGMLLLNHGYAVLGCEKGREGSEEHEEELGDGVEEEEEELGAGVEEEEEELGAGVEEVEGGVELEEESGDTEWQEWLQEDEEESRVEEYMTEVAHQFIQEVMALAIEDEVLQVDGMNENISSDSEDGEEESDEEEWERKEADVDEKEGEQEGDEDSDESSSDSEYEIFGGKRKLKSAAPAKKKKKVPVIQSSESEGEEEGGVGDKENNEEAEDEEEEADADKEKEEEEVTVKDRLKRDHLATPGTGTAKMYEVFAAAEVTPSTICEHVNHLATKAILNSEFSL